MPRPHGILAPVALAAALVLATPSAAKDTPAAAPASTPDWSMNATIIEACSCPMFCQCYFSTKPAGHAMAGTESHGHEHMAMEAGKEGQGAHDGADHYCRFNNAFHVNKGSYGATALDGARFWVAGDLGAEFSDGEMDWAVLTFDPAVTPAQREGVQAVLAHLYPVKWKAFAVAPDAAMEWKASKDEATATLAGGKTAEVVLARNRQSNTDAPIVIQNLKYWGAPRNDGFVLMQNGVEAYRAGDKAFEFKGTNGFMITFDINSKDVVAAH